LINVKKREKTKTKKETKGNCRARKNAPRGIKKKLVGRSERSRKAQGDRAQTSRRRPLLRYIERKQQQKRKREKQWASGQQTEGKRKKNS